MFSSKFFKISQNTFLTHLFASFKVNQQYNRTRTKQPLVLKQRVTKQPLVLKQRVTKQPLVLKQRVTNFAQAFQFTFL